MTKVRGARALEGVSIARAKAQQRHTKVQPDDLFEALREELEGPITPRTYSANGSERLGIREAFELERWGDFGESATQLAQRTALAVRKRKIGTPPVVTVEDVAEALGVEVGDARAGVKEAVAEGFIAAPKNGPIEITTAGMSMLAGCSVGDREIRELKARKLLGVDAE
jgi:hypothetical protein